MAKITSIPPVPSLGKDTLAVISDSALATDSLTASGDSVQVLLMQAPKSHWRDASPRTSQENGFSWLLVIVLLLFVMASFRFRKNFKFVGTLFQQVTGGGRHKTHHATATVRETSFMMILNVLCGFCFGMIIYAATWHFQGSPQELLREWWCILLSLVYVFALPLFYRMWGLVFTNTRDAMMWVNGLMAEQALLGLALLPAALVCQFNIAASFWMFWVAMGILLFGKISFLLKGLRIFIKDFSSWVVFLYYLCSLEIAPLIILYILSSGNLLESIF